VTELALLALLSGHSTTEAQSKHRKDDIVGLTEIEMPRLRCYKLKDTHIVAYCSRVRRQKTITRETMLVLLAAAGLNGIVFNTYSPSNPDHLVPCTLDNAGTIFLQRAQCSHCKRCTSYSNSVHPSVCLSVTRRYCVKTTARSTVQFSPLDSKMCLVLYKPKNIPQGRPLPTEILAQSDLPTPEGCEF